MLVVADEAALGVGGKRGLARAGEAEEDGHVAGFADVRRAVHRHHAALREQVVEDRKHALLRLAGVGGSADEDEALAEVHEDERVGARAVGGGVGLEAREVDDGELGLVILALRLLGADEHGARKQRVPGQLVDDAHGQAVARVGPGEGVLHEEFTGRG